MAQKRPSRTFRLLIIAIVGCLGFPVIKHAKAGYKGGISVIRKTVRERLLWPFICPGSLIRFSLEAIRWVWWVCLRLLRSPGDARYAIRELYYKTTTFLLVPLSCRIMDVAPGPDMDLAGSLARMNAFDDFEAAWLAEGLTHDYVSALFHSGSERLESPIGTGGDIPAKWHTIMSVGTGLALAQHAFEPQGYRADETALENALDRFLTLADDWVAPSYRDAAIDSLGTYIRVFRPFHLQRVDNLVQRRCPSQRRFFWHGVGRGIYFAPEHIFPFTDRLQIRRLFEEADEEMAYFACAGFAWAVTLVNFSDPETLDRVWVRGHSTTLADNPGFARGIASAVLMHREITGEDAESAGLHQFEGSLAWRELVRQPSRRSLENWFPLIQAHGSLVECLLSANLENYVEMLKQD